MLLVVNENSEMVIDLVSSLAGIALLTSIFAINAYMLYTLKRIKTYIKKRGEK